MQLQLEKISKKVGRVTHLYPMDLVVQPNAVTVLLSGPKWSTRFG